MWPSDFHWLYQVSAPDLHLPDLLHTIYRGLFKNMINWIQGFLKKHGQLHAFDEASKTLPPYPAFFVPKKVYQKITQLQGKEMPNLGRCFLGVLAGAPRQPDSIQVIHFKHALTCIRVFVDFNTIAQYHSHTDGTMANMENQRGRFHQMKDIFFDFRVTKCTQVKIEQK